MSLRDQIRQGDSREVVDRFASVAPELYPDTDHPGMPTVAATRAFIDADSPTRRACETHFVLADGPSGRGRVAAILNPNLRDEADRPIGLLGFFECDENDDTARWLIDVAITWLSKRGCAIVRGPVNFTTWHDYRFVTSSKVAEWIPGEPHHHDHYPQLWQAAELEEVATYSSNWLGDACAHRDRFTNRAAEAQDDGYQVRGIQLQDLGALHALSSASFASAYMYTPITFEEFEALYTLEQATAVAKTSYLALAPSGEPVGFLYAFPMTLDGKSPVSVCKTVAVIPEHQDRAVYHQLMHRWFSDALDAGCVDFVGALMHRDGDPALMGWTKPETAFKEYKVYERSL